jgi:aminoglycoside/choline kinase family phosphotransferase
MQHQNSFVLPSNLGRQGLLQISQPTAEQIAAAAALINEASDRLAALLALPAVA